jgi:hypothetical protein
VTGRLSDAATDALRAGRTDPPGTRVGVRRDPSRAVRAVVDENRRALGPPPALLASFRERREDFAVRGLCREGAHEAAFDAVDFAARYRAHLDDDPGAGAALDDLAARLRDGEDLTLVCVENTAKMRCHRTTLRERLAERVASE